jgi:hypothetical protein
MKRYLALASIYFSIIATADVPNVVITTLTSANGHGTVAGHLESKPQGSVGVSVRNGNVIYSTIADSDGRWGIVIRHLSTQVTVSSWSLASSTERGKEIVAELND